MKNKFCILQKDAKTYTIIQRYCYCLDNNIDLLKEDNKIQAEEIIMHKYSCGKNGTDWTNNNADNERLYLNTLKIITYLLKIEHLDFNKENCDHYIDIINTDHCFLDTIISKIF